MRLLRALSRLLRTAVAAMRLGRHWVRGHPDVAPARLREVFESLGATYVKVGQFIASAPSVFPRPYVTEFQGCLDRSRPLPFGTIERILRRELGARLTDAIERVDPEPLASASIAQVHAAKLRSGEDVVLKVQRPGVDVKLHTDLWLLRQIWRVVERLQPAARRISAVEIAEDMRRTFTEECDFQLEARRLQEFRTFLDSLGIREVTAPRVYENLTTSRVLTMERLFGEPLTDASLIEANTVDAATALMNAMIVWQKSVTHCSFFHADVHAGNLLLLERGRVAYIDFGIVGAVELAEWNASQALIEALGRNDTRAVADALVRLDAADPDVDTAALATDLASVLNRIRTMDAGQRGDGPGALLIDLFAVGERHGLRFPRRLFLLLKQYLYFDRYLRLISPTAVDAFSLGPLRRILFE